MNRVFLRRKIKPRVPHLAVVLISMMGTGVFVIVFWNLMLRSLDWVSKLFP